MINKYLFTAIAAFLIYFFPQQYSINAQEMNEPVSLKILADNTKFRNAVLFLNLKKHDNALQGFQEYLEVFPNGIHRKEAYTRIAEIYFNQFSYIKSLKTYKSLFEEFSNSREGAEAYYKTGICYMKMGYFESAKKVFKSILNDYTYPSVIQSSKTHLDLIDILAEKK